MEHKKHSPHSDGKSKKSNPMEEDNDSVSKLTEAAEKLEKILSVDLRADDPTDRSKIGGAHDEKGGAGSSASGSGANELTRQSPKNSDKSAFDNANRTADNNSASNEKKNLRTELIDDNHSNISDSDVGDFPDDLDDSSNDSVKSSHSHSFVSRLAHKSGDVPIKSDAGDGGGGGASKSDLKGGATTDLAYNFLDDLNTSDTTDSNSSEKTERGNAFNLMRDCSTAAAAGLTKSISDATARGDQRDESSPSLTKTSPTSDTKLKSVSSCVGLSLDSAIGSKSVDDDNAMSDLHTDNISDDEYDDIKPDSLTSRKADIRNNENFESIAQYISPAPMSLNTLISADYSNLSDNNDTNSNDNNRDSNDSKRNENSPSILKPASHDSSRITDKDIMEPGELLGKTLLDSQDSNLTCESLTGDNGKPVGKTSFLTTDNNNKDKSESDTVDLIGIDSTKPKTDGFGLGESTGSKTDFSALHAIKKGESGGPTDGSKGNNTSSGGSKQENRNSSENTGKTDDEIYELNFLDEHSMNDSNQSGILDIFNDPTKVKANTVLLPNTANIDMDSESLSQIMDSIKSQSPLESEQKRSNTPGSENARAGDDRFNSKTATSGAYINLDPSASSSTATAAANDNDTKPTAMDLAASFGKDNLASIELIKARPLELTREIEIKIENPSEFLPEQITQSMGQDDLEIIPIPMAVEKKSSGGSGSTSKSGGDSSKKSRTSEYGDASGTSKTSSSGGNSSRSSKSNKKSKHSKVESSSKKSSKSSSKSDKNKSGDFENMKNSENSGATGGGSSSAAAAANQSGTSSSSKKTKESSGNNSSRKRVLKSSKRPHRTFYSSAKRNMLNMETLASLMKTPNLSVRNHDIIAECSESAQSLYDFSTWEAWMNHPVKRFKPGERFTSRAIFKELQEMYAKQNVRLADFKNNPPNSVESKSVSDGLHTSDEDVDQDYYNDSGSVSK